MALIEQHTGQRTNASLANGDYTITAMIISYQTISHVAYVINKIFSQPKLLLWFVLQACLVGSLSLYYFFYHRASN